ncbi:GNAT family N-acetyltransferase [Paenibacillus sp. FSL R7-0331]|uniref:GNAT family N-acetyltransferase n=1 Tax=Paenibacillus sp. FSL R7-0331 TaxID=1536773 RepID=UPI0004F8C789|nr:GNAT family N-acetyltransferase [Paenibacillus sp. FSL R7-0331]AIQ55208.1 GNAT family acetyltraansferase [Paenibacillus sp. FSL R7-0331]
MMIKLVRMDEPAFQFFLQQATRDYAEDKVRIGAWDQETAMKLSQEEMTRFLPQGLYTEGAYLYSIVEEETGTQAGYIWFNVNRGRQGKEAFIYDFYIFEPYQRNGYGSGALALLDDEARSMGVTQIGLHVFGDNERALKLYQKMGYGITDISMSKKL